MDSMEIDDDIYLTKSLTMEGLITQVDVQRRKQPCRCVTVCLGLLCVVLLAGNIGQIIYYGILTHPSSANSVQASYNTQERDHLQNDNDILTTERDQLQSNCDALTAEREQLEAKVRNVTKEKDQLQQSFSSLSTERDEFKGSFNNLKNVRDQLQANYDALKQESNQLNTSCNDMQRNLEGLQTEHNNLTASKDQLQTKYRNLQRQKDELQNRFSALTSNRDELQSNYSSLKRDKDQLQRSYNTLSTSKDHLQISYNSLWKDKEQLQSRYNALWRVKEWLQTNYSSLAAERDRLQNKTNKLTVKVRGKPCQTGWRKFDISCYFISTIKKNWTVSRKDCIAKGADLVIIDSRDEQVFVNGLLGLSQNAWIGLTDSLQEGTWTWVDGTPLTMDFWQPRQPNNFSGNQDCGEIVQKPSVGEWNDDGCFAEQLWICEK